MNSKEKGKRGERELARKLKEYGYDCRRGQQYCGANGDADVVGLDGIHIEVKRTERLNLQDAMSQAIGDSNTGEFPAVFHRRNNDSWKVTMLLDDWIKLYNEWRPAESATEEIGRTNTGGMLIDYWVAKECKSKHYGMCRKCGECGRFFKNGLMVDTGGTTE